MERVRIVPLPGYAPYRTTDDIKFGRFFAFNDIYEFKECPYWMFHDRARLCLARDDRCYLVKPWRYGDAAAPDGHPFGLGAPPGAYPFGHGRFSIAEITFADAMDIRAKAGDTPLFVEAMGDSWDRPAASSGPIAMNSAASTAPAPSGIGPGSAPAEQAIATEAPLDGPPTMPTDRKPGGTTPQGSAGVDPPPPPGASRPADAPSDSWARTISILENGRSRQRVKFFRWLAERDDRKSTFDDIVKQFNKRKVVNKSNLGTARRSAERLRDFLERRLCPVRAEIIASSIRLKENAMLSDEGPRVVS